MDKYIKLATAGTNYATRMNRLSNRIFGEVARPTTVKSMNVVRRLIREPRNMKDYIGNYYPKHNELHWLTWNLRLYGLFRDEHQDYKDEMKRLRALRGKLPWQKGQRGKKAQLADLNK